MGERVERGKPRVLFVCDLSAKSPERIRLRLDLQSRATADHCAGSTTQFEHAVFGLQGQVPTVNHDHFELGIVGDGE
ncbi:hypothetical protein D3C80_1749460 [compost metagenome]